VVAHRAALPSSSRRSSFQPRPVASYLAWTYFSTMPPTVDRLFFAHKFDTRVSPCPNEMLALTWLLQVKSLSNMVLFKPKTMNTEEQGGGHGPLILFPEIIGISILTLLLPFPLAHMLLSGRALLSIAGFALWFGALFFAVCFTRRRQYVLIYLPMLAMVGLYFIIRKLTH
jgi:hypothetical protein